MPACRRVLGRVGLACSLLLGSATLSRAQDSFLPQPTAGPNPAPRPIVLGEVQDPPRQQQDQRRPQELPPTVIESPRQSAGNTNTFVPPSPFAGVGGNTPGQGTGNAIS